MVIPAAQLDEYTAGIYEKGQGEPAPREKEKAVK
jgi:hypothetical protein